MSAPRREETGFIQRVPVLDAAGKPTGEYRHEYGAEGEKGYFKWLARTHPGYFASLYGRLIPLDVNHKVEEKTVVRYETVEERRQAMIAKGWSPAVLAAMEEAMEPKFLRDMREKGSWLILTLRTSSKRATSGPVESLANPTS